MSSQQQHQQQLEEAIRTILNSNSDADSKVCFVTLLKIIDNVLQKPGNPKVRSIRTSNKAIQTKIVDRGGDRFLLACGFVPCREPATIGNPLQLEDKLVLNPSSEDTNLLIQARHTLANSAVRALGMTPDELPVYKPPPPQQPTQNLERDLLVLKQREAKLQREMASKHATTTTKKSTTTNHPPAIDRQWTVFLPGQSQPSSSSSKLQQTKVYSHTQLAIHFPDGVSVRANFSTTEPLDGVVQSRWEDVLLPAGLPPLELYQTPPRRVLAPPTATLHQLGLVPTAKIYVSWKQPLRAANTALVAGWYVRPKLLRKPPPSRPVLPTSKKRKMTNAERKEALMRRMTNAERKEALMLRMMRK